MDTLNRILQDPKYHDYLAILKGGRNGLVYGTKIRFPHALLMSILFGRGSWKERAKMIVAATQRHATSLGAFVVLYKTLLLLQKKINGGKPRNSDTFFAGLLGGYIVFGERNAINEQIVLYVCSRVVASFIPRSRAPADVNRRTVPPDTRLFAVFAAISWGAVMWIFNNKGHTLQGGMYSSMRYLYQDSERWDNLRTLIWYNT